MSTHCYVSPLHTDKGWEKFFLTVEHVDKVRDQGAAVGARVIASDFPAHRADSDGAPVRRGHFRHRQDVYARIVLGVLPQPC